MKLQKRDRAALNFVFDYYIHWLKKQKSTFQFVCRSHLVKTRKVMRVGYFREANRVPRCDVPLCFKKGVYEIYPFIAEIEKRLRDFRKRSAA